MMRKIITAALCFTFLSAACVASAFAGPDSTIRARQLMARLHKHPPKRLPTRHALDTPLLAFLSSPKVPLQNQNLTILVKSLNLFTGRELSLDADLNGAPISNVQSPAKGLFAVALGLQTQVKSATLNATLYAADPTANSDIRAAIKALDTDINRLTNQINAERNPMNRKALEEQRDEKVALKNELLTQLKAYRVKLGSQSYAFSIQSDPSSVNQPRITGLAPSVGGVSGGTFVAISGQNFLPNPRVLFGGVLAPSATLVNSNTIQAVTPNLGNKTGSMDVEIQFPTAQGTVNVISLGAFFAVNLPSGGAAQNPVAIAAGSQRIPLGESVQLDGSQSYSTRPTSLSYSWTFVSTPSGSNFVPGQGFLFSASPTFTPDAPGTYVAQLVVTEADTAEHLASAPSLVVIQADASPQPTAGAISVLRGTTATSTVSPNDPIPGEPVSYSISQAPLHGTASVSSSGLVTYSANLAYVGSDSLIVKVTGQGGLYGTVAIPVTVFDAAPQPSANGITVFQAGSATTQVAANDPVPGDAVAYEITQAPAHGTASVSNSGLVTYVANNVYVGSDSLVVKVTGQGGLFGTVNIPVTVADGTPHPTAGAITVNQGESATTQVSANDPVPGESVTYAISQAPLHGTASVSGSGLVTYTANSNYGGSDSLTVRVATPSGLFGEVVIQVTVLNPVAFTMPPLLANQLRQGSPFAVNLAAFTSDGGPITTPNGLASLTWDFGDGVTSPAPFQVIPGFQNAAQVEHSYLAPGTYTAKLTAVDQGGSSAFSTVSVKVGSGPLPIPIYTQDHFSGPVPLTVNFDGSGSFAPSGIASYIWAVPSAGFTPQASATASFTFTNPGTYQVIFRVTDANGLFSFSQATVYAGVTPPANAGAPIADFTVAPSWEGPINNAKQFAAYRSFDPVIGGGISSYAWKFGDFFSCPDGCTGTGVNPTHAYANATTYFPNLTVASQGGLTSLAKYYTVQAVTQGVAPFAVAKFTQQRGVMPLSVSADGSFSYDSDGTIQAYQWNFGDYAACPDGCTTNTSQAAHVYASPGAYVASLRVTDNDGNSKVSVWQILVTSSFAEQKFDDAPVNNSPEFNAMLGACSQGDGEACYGISQIYEAQGNSSAAQSFKQRACSLNYQPACVFLK